MPDDLTPFFNSLREAANQQTPAPPVSTQPEPPSSSAPTPSATGADEPCAPEDFEARPWYSSEGAAGTSLSNVTLRMREGERACLLEGLPQLEGTRNSGGGTATIPLSPRGEAKALRLSPVTT